MMQIYENAMCSIDILLAERIACLLLKTSYSFCVLDSMSLKLDIAMLLLSCS